VSTDEVADALVLISLALRAGLPLTEALHHVRAEATGRVCADLGAVAAALRWGRPAQEAWSFAGPGWRAAAMATHMSEHTGAAPAVLTCGAGEENIENNREMAAALGEHLHELGDLHNYTAWRDALDPHLTNLLAALW